MRKNLFKSSFEMSEPKKLLEKAELEKFQKQLNSQVQPNDPYIRNKFHSFADKFGYRGLDLKTRIRLNSYKPKQSVIDKFMSRRKLYPNIPPSQGVVTD